MSQSTENHTADLVGRLIDVCRDTQFSFEIAAGGVSDRLLRAELLQYCGQRRDFVADLVRSLHDMGTRVIDPGSIDEPLRRNSEALRDAVQQHDAVAIIGECERCESDAQHAYEDALTADVSGPLHALIHAQLSAISRVQHRLHRLRNNAQSIHN